MSNRVEDIQRDISNVLRLFMFALYSCCLVGVTVLLTSYMFVSKYTDKYKDYVEVSDVIRYVDGYIDSDGIAYNESGDFITLLEDAPEYDDVTPVTYVYYTQFTSDESDDILITIDE